MLENTSRLTALAVFASLGCSCGSTRATDEPHRPARPAPGVLATVNGKPITEADVRLASRAPASGHGPAEPAAPSPEHDRNVLETVIRDELIAQRAEALHLDRDGDYQSRLVAMQAQLEAFRRSKLVELFEQRERRSAEVTAAEARQYFDANVARLRVEVHVWQILMRDESRVEQAHREVVAGTPFEQVARLLYPSLPAGETPWDLGFLRWNQVPDAWRSVVYGMSPGQTSDVIRGPRNRYWIIRLVERREDPSVTFESTRTTIEALLHEERVAQRRAEVSQELRRNARITYVRAPVPGPAARPSEEEDEARP